MVPYIRLLIQSRSFPSSHPVYVLVQSLLRRPVVDDLWGLCLSKFNDISFDISGFTSSYPPRVHQTPFNLPVSSFQHFCQVGYYFSYLILFCFYSIDFIVLTHRKTITSVYRTGFKTQKIIWNLPSWIGCHLSGPTRLLTFMMRLYLIYESPFFGQYR